MFFLLLPITGRGTTTALIALTAYTLQIIFRNIITGPRQRARRTRATPGAAWGSPIASCCGGWSCRSPCPTSSPACGSPPPRTVGLATLAVFAGAGGLGEQIVDRQQHHVQDRRGRGRRAGGAAGARARRGAARRAARDDAVAEGAARMIGRPSARLPVGLRGRVRLHLQHARGPDRRRAGGRAGRGARVHLGAPEGERRRDRRRMRGRDPGRARARARRQGRAARDQHLQHRPRGAEPGADRVLRRLHRASGSRT